VVWRPQPRIPRQLPPCGSEQARLVARSVDGDGDAFARLVDLRLLPAFRLARAILGTTEEAEDAVQEAFIAAWRALPTLHDPERFDAWFSRIVVNACRMAMRRRPHVTVIPIDDVAADRMDETASVERLVDVEALHRALDTLSFQERAILALRYLEDRPLASVAAILEIPVGTAKWRLSEARASLRRAMAAAGELPAQAGPAPGPLRSGPTTTPVRVPARSQPNHPTDRRIPASVV
jgi:RNA polymerase sigma-70 factor, ECF subfamily